MKASLFLSALLLSLLVGLAWATLGPFEQTYLTLPNRNNTRQFLFNYTSHPHIAGSPGDYNTAVYTRDKFLSFGWNSTIQPVQVLLNYPLQRVLQLLNADGSVAFSANMTEPALAQDPTSDEPDIVNTFNGYSGSGNVTAPLVFANYGRIQDFTYLQTIGVNVTGKIVIVKYGGVFRGVKAMLAQKFGAAGLLIYSDPADDGFVKAGGVNNTYPNGPWRPELGVQRGSVQFLPICPGAPSQERVAVCLGEDHANESFVGALIPSIPVQPISWGDAAPLLAALSNTPLAPAEWQGGLTVLNISYNIGPSTVNVSFALVQNYTTVDIWNVISTLPGATADEIVLLGNHRDAWVFGATDPNSGSSTMLEIARSLGVLRSTTSWVPQRDIVFCSWDAEEYGLMGSTAWGEANAEYLQSHAIAYINTDVGVGGPYLGVGGTPSLLKFFTDIASDLVYPGNTSMSLLEHWNYLGLSNPQMDVLGSGSDYTVFLDNLGIPCMDFGYDGYSEAGIYHSIYDSFTWMENYGDPEFIFHEGLAQLLGVIVMRLADSPLHPFNYTNYASQLSVFLQNIQTNATTGADFTPLQSAVNLFATAGAAIDAQSACAASNSCVSAVDLNALNARLRFTERRLLTNAITNDNAGLPLRPWFKHVVQAPGLYLGYGSQTFPGIEQGILDNNLTLVQQQIQVAANAISNAAQALTELSVSGPSPQLKCHGDSTSIQLTSVGGFTPVRYSLNGTTWQTQSNFTGVAGTYTVYVMDALGLTATAVVNVSQPQKLEIKVNTNKDEASAVITGGYGNYTLRWSTNETASAVKLPKSGDYEVTVTDSNGCSATTTFKYSPGRGLSGGAVAGIVIAVTVAIAAIVAILYYIKKRRHTQHYQNLFN